VKRRALTLKGTTATVRPETKHVPASVSHEDWLLERLCDPQLAAEYLNAAVAEGDQAVIMLALRDVANASGRGTET